VAGHAPDRLDVGAASRGAARRGADAVGRLEAGASEIRLGPLDETAVAQVARDMLGGEPDEALRQMLSRAGGQPFLLTELLRGLRGKPRDCRWRRRNWPPARNCRTENACSQGFGRRCAPDLALRPLRISAPVRLH
jgi:hypothetical protein